MVCESWKTKLDTYLDDEVPEEEMRNPRRSFAQLPLLLGGCSCARTDEARNSSRWKTFYPTAEFHRRVRHGIAPKPQRSLGLGWMFVAAAVMVVVGTLTSGFQGTRSGRDQVLSQIADLHVATLASLSPVDVISTEWAHGEALVPGKNSPSHSICRTFRTLSSHCLAAG